jgi:ADP-heptose:LPS heptosyltransferase
MVCYSRYLDKKIFIMQTVIIFKNDRLGDLFHSLNGINNILNEHKNDNIIIYLSKYSKDFSFLFNQANVQVKFLNYHLTLIEKFKILKIFFNNSIDKVFILSPKNYYFYLCYIFKKTKFYAITVKEADKNRPFLFLNKYLFKFRTNNRKNKRKNESIKNIIEDLCSNNLETKTQIINTNITSQIKFNSFSRNRYCHFHFKKFLYKKKNWSFHNINSFLNILLKKNYKIFLTSDIEKNEFNEIFKNNFKTIDFEKKNFNVITSDLNDDILYLENIKSLDLFSLIKDASLVVSPHGTMTVMASYLKVPVMDIFDDTINKIAFYEYKPDNKDYKFMILKSFSERQLLKINRLLSSV